MNAKLTIWLPPTADAHSVTQAVRPLIPAEFEVQHVTHAVDRERFALQGEPTDACVEYELWCRGSLRTMGQFVEAVHAALPDMDVTLSAGNARGEILCIEYEAGNPKPVQSHVREYEGWCDYAW